MKYFLPTVLITFSLFGCSAEQSSSQNVQNNTTENTAQSANNVATSLSQGYVSPLPDDAPVYTVAMTGTSPPFSLKDDNGLLTGIDVDVIRSVGELEGFKVKFVSSKSWNDMLEMAGTGKVDLALSGISYREERAEKYALSDAYFFNPVSIAYADVSLNVQDLQDLQGTTIGGVIDGTSIEFARTVADAKVIEQKSSYLAYSALVRGDIDATIYDYPVLKFYAKNMPEYPIIVTPIEEEDEVNNKGAFAVIMSAKENTDLIEKVNSGLTKLKEQGKIQEIEKKWLQSE